MTPDRPLVPIPDSKLDAWSDAFNANAETTQALVADLQGRQALPRKVVARMRATSTCREASFCRASACSNCSIPARPSWNFRNWRRTK